MQDTENTTQVTRSKIRQLIPESVLEKLGSRVDSSRFWFSQAWKIGLRMAQGAYLTTERKRLFGKLGEEVFYKIQKGEWQNPDLAPMVEELGRLSLKLEQEELEIRTIRFGERKKQANTDGETDV